MYINNPNASTQSTNTTQYGGTNLSTGIGASGAGIPRFTDAADSAVTSTFVTGAPLVVGGTNHQDYTPNAACVLVFLSNTSTTLTVYVRDQAATTDTQGIQMGPGATLFLATRAPLRITNANAGGVTVTVNEVRTP